MSAAAQRLARDPRTWIAALVIAGGLLGSWWNLPCTDAWSNDEVSPRASTLAAVFETWTPGHFFRYPPLHVLLLTVLQLPVIVAGALRAGFGVDALGAELIRPGYMTASAVIGRAVALAMAVGVALNLRALWERLAGPRAGLAAGIVTALNPIFVYFAHTASVDVPWWFWTTRAMLELDRVAAGEPRERVALLLCAAAMLTKDQSAFVLAGALVATCVLVPLARKEIRAIARPAMLRAGALAAAVYLVVSGAAVNPSGFRRKLAWMTGEGNAGWTAYDRTLDGALAQLVDIARAAPAFVAWPLAIAAVLGIALARRDIDRVTALRRLAPAAAALSYLALFVVPSRWTMERHLCPLALLLAPYAWFTFAAAAARARPLARLVAGLSLGWMALEVVSVGATLAADARPAVTDFLRALPPGTAVEVYGGNQYLPMLPPQLALTRVGPDAPGDRSALPGVREVQARYGDIAARAPAFLVVSESTARQHAPLEAPRGARAIAAATDPDAHPFFTDLLAGRRGYRLALRSRCALPWPLRCKRIHFSTGAEAWVFARAGALAAPAPGVP